MTEISVGSRILFPTFDGSEIDITIDELEERSTRYIIKRATVHAVTFSPMVKQLGIPRNWIVPPEWTDAS